MAYAGLARGARQRRPGTTWNTNAAEPPGYPTAVVCEPGMRTRSILRHRVRTLPWSYSCDGVGSAANGDIAAQVAVDAAGRELTTAIQSFDQRLGPAMTRAMGIASEAVSAVSPSPGKSARPPAATFVSIAQRGEEIAIGWVGDRRRIGWGLTTRSY